MNSLSITYTVRRALYDSVTKRFTPDPMKSLERFLTPFTILSPLVSYDTHVCTLHAHVTWIGSYNHVPLQIRLRNSYSPLIDHKEVDGDLINSLN